MRGESRRTPKASDGFAGWDEGYFAEGGKVCGPLTPTPLPQGERGFKDWLYDAVVCSVHLAVAVSMVQRPSRNSSLLT
ncbi:hypothetical protein EJ913_11520 [Azospirillum doebereinerae]|uniref:Uncharacterized protein n=1 Tax=Azospirillum doebereinerae TaxID=92933 RepID=A0A433JA39_9PROT|nr:hypothetical protein EJ913_11520 [Azospirillum doebereinerae]